MSLNLKEIEAYINNEWAECGPMGAKAEALLRALRETRTALQPFARFAAMWDAKPITGLADTFYAIHTGTEWAAELAISDMQRARTVLEGVRDD